MHPVRTSAFLLVALIAAGTAIAVAQPGRGGGDRGERTALLRDGKGKRVGTVTFRQNGGRGPVSVTARVRGLPAGFHGFHIHAVGQCQAPSFMSAMGHLKRGAQNHPTHIGDLPVLLVNRSGSGRLSTLTDRFDLRDLRDRDGAAVIVHALPDNYANIPTRYTPQPPDQTTLDTGDAGPRLACGAVR
jgi:superoxide dismutase, Cu-Zn family